MAHPWRLLWLGLLVVQVCTARADPISNELTVAQRDAGWTLLFDGRSTTGWHTFRETAVRPEWQVIDGALTLTSAGGGDLLTNDLYGDFDLRMEWRIARRGNSGILYRVLDEGPYVFMAGPEYQLLDNLDAVEPPAERASAVFDLYAPTVDASRPAGEYNETRIRVERGAVEHWLNGVKVVEYRLDSPDFMARMLASKYGPEGALGRWTAKFGKVRRGHIALQDHGHRIAFRNIRIQALN